MRDVNANPFAFQSLCDCDSSPTTTERVENSLSLVSHRLNDAFKKCLRLLCRVAQTLLRLGVDWWNVIPQIVNGVACQFIEIPFPSNPLGLVNGEIQSPFSVHPLHRFARHCPSFFRRLVPFVFVN